MPQTGIERVRGRNSTACQECVNENDYESRDRFLWDSLLIFSLRQGFTDAATQVIRVMRKHGQMPACLLYWCVATQSSYLPNLLKSNQPARSIAASLRELATNAAFMAKAVRKRNGSMADLLERYKLDANKAVMFFLLDAEPSCDWADLIATFNTVFAPESSDAEVQAFRSQFAQLLVSPEDTEKFLQEVWKPQRESILATLAGISRSIIACLPITIFDKIGSREQALFDEFIRKFRTELSALILRVLASKQACTEQELLQITEEASKWTTPAV